MTVALKIVQMLVGWSGKAPNKLRNTRDFTWKSSKMASCGSPSSPTTNIMLLDQKSPCPETVAKENLSSFNLKGQSREIEIDC
jgi:hypothetical protein